jgi:hypothetical protein
MYLKVCSLVLLDLMCLGVRNTTTLFDRDPLDRFRRPRFIAKDGVVRPYSAFEGQSPFIYH